MAQFKGSLTGTSGTVTRLGSKASGMQAEVAGWGGGVRIVAHTEGENDEFDLYSTRGSNGGDGQFLGTVTCGGRWTPAPQE
jgi:hypothetical protein